MKKKVVIIDYGLGNIFSINQGCKYFGFDPRLSRDKEVILNADSIILPGVGSFDYAMRHLIKLRLVDILTEFFLSGKPIMGICLGMQLLFERSNEFGLTKGLGFIEGEIRRLPIEINNERLIIPHMGWNQIKKGVNSWNETPLKEVKEDEMMYFVHSYYADPVNKLEILSKTEYQGFPFCSAVKKGNLYGFQYHPEKSGKLGLSIYKNFLSL